ncbi:MAG: PAS domain S-box protein [Methanomassiliicoccales archaeon]|nr:PAS domain S-box protein [Methanomassiliicoccales archaeon]
MVEGKQILVLEDDLSDFELVRRELRSLGPGYVIRQASDEKEFLDALASRPDVILLDYSLPDYDGLTAMGIARATWPGVPVIIVSGRIGEDAAIEALKGGATDYVLKNRLSRLTPVTARALEEAKSSEESRRSEQALKESEERFRIAFEHAPNGMCITTTDGKLIRANESFARMLGRSIEEMPRLDFDALTHPDDLDQTNEYTRALLPGEQEVYRFEKRYSRKDGTVVWGDVSASLVRDAANRPCHILTNVFDITPRKYAERMLQEEKEKLAVTLRSIGDGVIVTDVEGKVVMLNTVAERLTGWTTAEALGQNIECVFHIISEDTRERCDNPVRTVLKSQGVCSLVNHTVLIARDGTERLLGDSGALITDAGGNVQGVVLVFRDVTEERRTQSELERMQRLDSIGLLAGGIAHDFNNLLTVIEGNLALARIKQNDEKAVEQRLADAERAMARARALTKQLLAFSSGGEPIKEVLEPEAVLRSACGLALSGSNVRCEYDIEPGLWRIEADEGQISQAISNVVMNSREAMPDGGIGHIIARNHAVKRSELPPLKEGRYIHVIIRDTGVGIPGSVLPRVFDPFFSTKQSGRGLGLAVAHAIVTRHGGHISISSAPGKGTEVVIHLPATDKLASEKGEMVLELSKGRQRVLWMDDEELILELGREMLASLGYRPAVARDGKEAMKAYRVAAEEGNPFDAVILDLVVPGGVGGMETIRALSAIDPDVKAIVCSGYSHDPVMSHFSRNGFVGVLPKPFGVQELSEVLAHLFAAEAPSPEPSGA